MGETPAVEDESEGPAEAEESVGEGSSAAAQERAWAQMPREALLELRYNLTQQLRLFPPQGAQQEEEEEEEEAESREQSAINTIDAAISAAEQRLL